MLPLSALGAGGAGGGLTDTTSQSLNAGPVSTGAKYFGGGNPNANTRAITGSVNTAIYVAGGTALVLGGLYLWLGNK